MPVEWPIETPTYPFVVQTHRETVTGEPGPVGGRADPHYPDQEWLTHRQRGGGHVPGDYGWTTNPKQHQEETGSGP